MRGKRQGERKMKNKLYGKVKKYIMDQGMIAPGDCVIAGVSGGADSVCMLHLLWRLQKEIPFRLSVVHVDHGLRPEAGEDAVFVETLCSRLKIPFFLRKADMPGYAAQHKISSEEAGRILRYQAFDEVLREVQGENAGKSTEVNVGKTAEESVGKTIRKDVGKIAVAHNAEDRAETMLFHMFRGSGLKGLGSIRPVRESVIRPLLTVNRAEIDVYLTECGLAYREDRTNGEDVYARNRIRHHILPYAQQEICSGAVSHMGELADILAETEDYLERETSRLYDRYVEVVTDGEPISGQEGLTAESVANLEGLATELSANLEGLATELAVNLEGLASEDGIMVKRVLLYALERITPHRKDIGARHIRSLMELMEKDGSKELSLPHGIKACKEYGILFLKQTNPKQTAPKKSPPQQTDCGREEGLSERGVFTVPETLAPDIPAEIIVPGAGSFIFVLREAESCPEASLFYSKEQNIPQNRYTKWFDYDKITTSLLLRTRRAGDYLTIDDALHTQSLKQYMINEKIPKGQRDRMYLLTDGSHVLWVPGYRDSSLYRVEKSTRRILEVRLRGGNDGGTNRGIVDGGSSR